MDSTKQINRLKKGLRKDFAGWIRGPLQKELFWDEAMQRFSDYADHRIRATHIAMETANVKIWHFTHYAAAALNENRHPLDELALAARYAQWAVCFEESFACANKGGSVLITRASNYFALQIIVGWREQAGTVGRALYRGLDTSLLDLRHNERHEKGILFRHFWFLMHLYCDVGGHPLDTSLYSYPEDMAPYAQVLADWRTEDVAKVHRWVCDMAEYHVAESDDSVPDAVNEFDDADAQLFPYEILAYLRLREWNGLPNPEKFDHPLMNQPLAWLPQPVPLAQPDTPLLDRVIERFRTEFAGLPPTR